MDQVVAKESFVVVQGPRQQQCVNDVQIMMGRRDSNSVHDIQKIMTIMQFLAIIRSGPIRSSNRDHSASILDRFLGTRFNAPPSLKTRPEESVESEVPGLNDFVAKHNLPLTIVRHIKKLDAQLQRYVIRKFKLPAENSKADKLIMKYLSNFLQYPQKWRIEALILDGNMDDECDTRRFGEDDEKVGAMMWSV